jgi:hypothetical protein
VVFLFIPVILLFIPFVTAKRPVTDLMHTLGQKPCTLL